jgi:GDP-L-fucose synthase
VRRDARIFVAGHRGLVGGAIVRELERQHYSRVVTRTHEELDLEDGTATGAFFAEERPEVVFLAAAKVGGILANKDFPVDFLMRNLLIQANVFRAAHANAVRRIILLGSSCIYPRECPQPIKEDFLLTGPLEPTNRPYALAKIAGVEMCWAYNRQYGGRHLAVMPTNLFGPGDNYDLASSHVLPALLRKTHEAKVANLPQVVIWGTGTPRREFMYADDLARAIVMLAALDDSSYDGLVQPANCPLINVGTGEDITIRELADVIADVVGYSGKVSYDTSKPDGTPRKVLDVSRMRALGWRPQTSLREGVERAYEDFLARFP